MDTGKEITNIQPTLRNPQTDVNTLSFPLDQNRLNAMFEDFVKLIDASPNTIGLTQYHCANGLSIYVRTRSHSPAWTLYLNTETR